MSALNRARGQGTHGPQEHRAVASERKSRERMACVDPVDTAGRGTQGMVRILGSLSGPSPVTGVAPLS